MSFKILTYIRYLACLTWHTCTSWIIFIVLPLLLLSIWYMNIFHLSLSGGEWESPPQSQTVLRVKMPPIVVLPDLDVSKEVNENDGHIEMDFLMPNGIFIPFRVDFYDSVENVKLVGQCLKYVTACYMYFFCSIKKLWVHLKKIGIVWDQLLWVFFSFVIVLAAYCFMFIYLCCFIGSHQLIFKVAWYINIYITCFMLVDMII